MLPPCQYLGLRRCWSRNESYTHVEGGGGEYMFESVSKFCSFDKKNKDAFLKTLCRKLLPWERAHAEVFVGSLTRVYVKLLIWKESFNENNKHDTKIYSGSERESYVHFALHLRKSNLFTWNSNLEITMGSWEA